MASTIQLCCNFIALVLLSCVVSVFAKDESWAGVYAPVVTPSFRDDDGNLTLSVIPRYARFLKNNNISGILIAGTVGEGPTVTLCQRKRLLNAWMRAAKPLGLKIIVQVGGLPLPDVKEMARYSQKVCADAIMTFPELYYKPTTPSQLVDFMEEIADAAPNITLFYHHLPAYSGVNLNMPEVHRMATKRIDTYKGMKCDFETAVSVKNYIQDDQTLFIYTSLSLAGAALLRYDTFMLAEANVFPRQVMDVYNAAYDGDLDETREAHERLANLTLAITCRGELGTAIKVSMRMVTGIDVGEAREPKNLMSDKQKMALRNDLVDLGIKIKLNV